MFSDFTIQINIYLSRNMKDYEHEVVRIYCSVQNPVPTTIVLWWVLLIKKRIKQGNAQSEITMNERGLSARPRAYIVAMKALEQFKGCLHTKRCWYCSPLLALLSNDKLCCAGTVDDARMYDVTLDNKLSPQN
jgi:hypothetical protein